MLYLCLLPAIFGVEYFFPSANAVLILSSEHLNLLTQQEELKTSAHNTPMFEFQLLYLVPMAPLPTEFLMNLKLSKPVKWV